MRAIVLANWGLGLEVLKTLHNLPDVEVELVITQFYKDIKDPWFNVVHDFATEHGIRTIEQDSVSFEEMGRLIKESKIDIGVVHAFMRIIPKEVFLLPKFGFINIHPSLLPKYRGPSPTRSVLQDGESETGLTCHYIDEGVDTGDIIYQLSTPVEPEDTVGTIIEKMKGLVGPLLIESLSRSEDPDFRPRTQDNKRAGNTEKLAKRLELS